jgi:hypothetical protein
MGITGFNDLGQTVETGPAACAAKCLANPACRSFDWNTVAHECWLSTADRSSAGSAYTAWRDYDYYEIDRAAPLDVCQYANDGECDESDCTGSNCSTWRRCDPGSDTADCGSNSCRYANDGECDEPNYCATGTDCSDCDKC